MDLQYFGINKQDVRIISDLEGVMNVKDEVMRS
jgi:hypothetical protein